MEYFLFGYDAIEIYKNNGIDELVETITNDLYRRPYDPDIVTLFKVVKYSEDVEPSKILKDFCGWNSFCEISMADYNKLCLLKK